MSVQRRRSTVSTVALECSSCTTTRPLSNPRPSTTTNRHCVDARAAQSWRVHTSALSPTKSVAPPGVAVTRMAGSVSQLRSMLTATRNLSVDPAGGGGPPNTSTLASVRVWVTQGLGAPQLPSGRPASWGTPPSVRGPESAGGCPASREPPRCTTWAVMSVGGVQATSTAAPNRAVSRWTYGGAEVIGRHTRLQSPSKSSGHPGTGLQAAHGWPQALTLPGRSVIPKAPGRSDAMDPWGPPSSTPSLRSAGHLPRRHRSHPCRRHLAVSMEPWLRLPEAGRPQNGQGGPSAAPAGPDGTPWGACAH